MFGDQAMLIAAIDRLVHHSIIFELNVESFRRRDALARKSRNPLASPKKAVDGSSNPHNGGATSKMGT